MDSRIDRQGRVMRSIAISYDSINILLPMFRILFRG